MGGKIYDKIPNTGAEIPKLKIAKKGKRTVKLNTLKLD
jgi:hypothetical protein